MKTICRALALATLVISPGLAQAQLGAAAPLPQIKKPEGPTLEETLKWIGDKLQSSPQTVFTYNYNGIRITQVQTSEILFAGCTATQIYTVVETNSKPSEWYSGDEIEAGEFPLHEMEVKVSEAAETRNQTFVHRGEKQKSPIGTIKLRTVGDKQIVVHTSPSARRKPKEFTLQQGRDAQIASVRSRNPDATYLQFSPPGTLKLPDVETAERVANAFRHAIKLCQQRAQQEKAAKSARQPNDLF